MERWNCTLRQKLARYVRKTLSFSKAEYMHHLVTCGSSLNTTWQLLAIIYFEPLPSLTMSHFKTFTTKSTKGHKGEQKAKRESFPSCYFVPFVVWYFGFSLNLTLSLTGRTRIFELLLINPVRIAIIKGIPTLLR